MVVCKVFQLGRVENLLFGKGLDLAQETLDFSPVALIVRQVLGMIQPVFYLHSG